MASAPNIGDLIHAIRQALVIADGLGMHDVGVSLDSALVKLTGEGVSPGIAPIASGGWKEEDGDRQGRRR